MYSRFHASPSSSSSSELLQVQQSFEPVIVELDDGNQFLMSKCSNCGFICRSNMNTKHAHWKRCPSKFMFKYLSQNESTSGCVLLCTMCNIKFMKPDVYTMKTHSQKCLRVAHQPTESVPYIFGHSFDTSSNSRNDAIKTVHENTVSRKEIEAQRKVLLMTKNKKVPITGFRIKYIPNENGAERHSECLVCNTLFRKPTNFTLKAHRSMCPYPSISYQNGILMSVSTQSAASLPFTTQSTTSLPFTMQSTTSQSLNSHQQLPFHMSSHQVPSYMIPPNTIPLYPMQSHQMISDTMNSQPMASQAMVSPLIAYQPSDSTITRSGRDDGFSRFTISQNISRINSPTPVKMCFICNTSSSESFVSLYQTTSKHTNTRIYDFVWRFLNDQPSVRDTSAAAANYSFVCAECLDMINEYDLVKSQAAKFENHLRDKISRTETYYMKRRTVPVPLESPTICAQREREHHQRRNSYDGDEVDTTARDSGQRYADEPNGAVHYLVELSDEDENEIERGRMEGEEDEGKEEDVEQVKTIVLSDDEDE